jgi:phosphoribosylformylglycinamidine synthase
MRNIAGILNAERNVMGLMPHPERAAEPLMGGTDGLFILESLLTANTVRVPSLAASVL